MPTARIYINGPIGKPPEDYFEESGTTLVDVRRQFDSFESPDSVEVFINSPGGDVREGFAIHDYLQALSLPVTTIGEGRIWSIASVIFMAGEKRLIAENATLLIHNPLAAIYGNADMLEEVAAYLKEVGQDIAEFYAEKTGQDVSMIADMMSAETELKAQDAITMNFATGLLQSVQAVAWISNKPNMSTEKKGLLDQIRALLKNEVAQETTPEIQEEVKEEATPQPTELELSQAKEIEELKAKLADAEKLEETVAAQNEVLKQVQAKLEAIENEPVVEIKPTVARQGKVAEKGVMNRAKMPVSFQETLKKWDKMFPAKN